MVKIARTRNDLKTSHLGDEKYTGSEPHWDAELALKMEPLEFDRHLRKSFYYYNYHFTQKDLKKYVVEWMQTNEYSKADISAFIRSPDRSVPMTACSIARAHKRGMPLREREVNYLKNSIAQAITEAEPVQAEETKTPVQVITIQDRLNEKTSQTIGELEGYYDELESIKFYDFLTAQNVPQGQLGKIEKVYADRRQELELAQSKKDEQLSEAYSHLKSADFKKRYSWIDALLDAIEQYRSVKKATKRVRAKRAPSKDKLIAKLKYLKEEKTLKLVSVDPTGIIGAQQLWVYDSKTRKLIQYVADIVTGPLGVKGTSITGYDESKSVGKTLRKPEEQLKAFAKSGKVELRKFLANIKAVETQASGRINENQILLKVL
jgi:hypothetical protein